MNNNLRSLQKTVKLTTCRQYECQMIPTWQPDRSIFSIEWRPIAEAVSLYVIEYNVTGVIEKLLPVYNDPHNQILSIFGLKGSRLYA